MVSMNKKMWRCPVYKAASSHWMGHFLHLANKYITNNQTSGSATEDSLTRSEAELRTTIERHPNAPTAQELCLFFSLFVSLFVWCHLNLLREGRSLHDWPTPSSGGSYTGNCFARWLVSLFVGFSSSVDYTTLSIVNSIVMFRDLTQAEGFRGLLIVRHPFDRWPILFHILILFFNVLTFMHLVSPAPLLLTRFK